MKSTGAYIILKDALYVPEFNISLISQGQLVQKGVEVQSNRKGCTLSYNKRVIATGELRQNLTLIRADLRVEKAFLTLSDADLWHQRMGHIGQKALQQLEGTIGFKPIQGTKTSYKDCETCIKAKAKANISREPTTPVNEYLEKVNSDVCGPISPATWSKRRYFVSFIDDKTRYAYTELLSTKDEVLEAYRAYKIREENQNGLTLKRLHSDNGLEYKSEAFKALHRSTGVVATYSAPYTPAQNGKAEIFNRTIMGKVRAMLYGANIPTYWWGEALEAAVYLYNRTPHSAIGFKTPFEAKTGQKPDLTNIRVWGSIAYKREPEVGLKKLAPRAKSWRLIGYGNNQYKLGNIATKKTVWARDVYILEGKYTLEDETLPNETQLVLEEETDPQLGIQPGAGYQHPIEPDQLVPETAQPQELDKDETDYSGFINSLREYVQGLEAEERALATIAGPKTFKGAISSPNAPDWQGAMEREVTELENQNTWTLVKLPPGRQSIPGRWVFTIKDTDNGPLYKGRWVAKGFWQQPGIDYNETYANTVNPIVYRYLLALAGLYNWEVRQWDVKNAFANASITEEIYVDQPTGLEREKGLVCRLNKALYGLKQSPREWEQHLRGLLENIGIKPLEIDQSAYKSVQGVPIILLCHVDDILALSPSNDRIQEVYQALSQTIGLKDLGEAKTFLGLEIERNRPSKVISLHQKAYTRRILASFYKEGKRYKTSKYGAIPLPIGVKYEPNIEKATESEVKQYQKEVGSLLYLTTKTRPDLAYSIGLLSRYMSNPSQIHFQALGKVWNYLYTYPDLGLTYQSGPQIQAYCDADWGGDIGTRRSTTGLISLYRGAPLIWASKLQKTVALSSCEAEYMALKEAIKEQEYLKGLTNSIKEFFKAPEGLKTLYTDSLSALELAKNPGHHYRTKHIDIQYHFVREKVQTGACDLRYKPTEDQLADFLTKTISALKWTQILGAIGLI